MQSRPTVSSVGFDDEGPFRQQSNRLLGTADEPCFGGGHTQLPHESSRGHLVLGGQAGSVFIAHRDPLPVKSTGIAECQLRMALEHVQIGLRGQDIRTQQAVLGNPSGHLMSHPSQEPLGFQHDGTGNIGDSAGQQEADSHIERLISGRRRNGALIDSPRVNSPHA